MGGGAAGAGVKVDAKAKAKQFTRQMTMAKAKAKATEVVDVMPWFGTKSVRLCFLFLPLLFVFGVCLVV